MVNLKRQRRFIFETVEKELVERYLTERALGCFSLVKPSDSVGTLDAVSRDLFSLVERFRGDKRVTSLNTFGVLLRVLRDQCDVSEAGEMTVKAPREIPSSSLQNPSDPFAGYDAHKGQGYQVQVMETYCPDEAIREETLNLITHVEVEPAHISDVHALIPALESTIDRGLAPKEVLADSLYGSDENIERAEELGVKVIAPVMGTLKEETLNLADFPQTATAVIAACPQGYAPVKYKRGKKGTCSVAFASGHCNECPLLERCPVKAGKKHHHLRFTLKALRIAGPRVREHTQEFREKYRWRSGVESTFSEMDRKTGIKRLRVRGLSAVGYCARLKAIGINLFRAARVKKALDTLRTSPGTALSSIGVHIIVVKERLQSQWYRFGQIFNPTSENMSCVSKIAA